MNRKSSGLEARLAAYGSMSLALAAVGMPAAANGQVSYPHLTATSGAPVFFDPATGAAGIPGIAGFAPAAGDFELQVILGSGSAFRDSILHAPASSFTSNGNNFAVSASSAAKLMPGATIDSPLLKFSSLRGTLASNGFASVPAGHWNAAPFMDDLGLSQTCGAASGSCYGWANITVDPETHSITLNSFGYDSSGAPVIAGSATPEPASIILLAMGAAGIAAWRRKKAVTR